MNDGKIIQGVGVLQEFEKRDVGKVTPEDVDAYIEQVMRELLYPFFLRKKLHKAIDEFLCSELGLDVALLEMPADQLGLQIGEPRDVAQDFAAACKYAWLRGMMPAWKKGLIVAALGVLIVAAVFLAVHVVWQLGYDHGSWRNGPMEAYSFDVSNDSHPNTQLY